MADMENLSGDFDKAKNYALKLLGARDYSSGELLKKLNEYYREETAEAALARVRELGYSDDEKYAEKLAASLIENKRYGIRRAKFEMRRKGLSDEIVCAALEKYGEEEILRIIAEFIGRKYADFLGDRAGIKKTIDALVRRGYDYADIKAGIERVREDIELEYD